MKQEFLNIPLCERNSFHLEQKAARLIEFDSVDDLVEIFEGGAPSQWMVLSGGNNILFAKDYSGVLLSPRDERIEIISEDRVSVRVRVAAGVEWDNFVEWAVENELWGVENLSKIPGKAGAAPVQNIGAYGVEVSDVLERVEMFCPATCNMLTLEASHCNFGYRESIFKGALRGKVIITSIVVKLSRVAAPNLGYGDVVSEVARLGGVSLRNIRDAIVSIRIHKLPDTSEFGNAGSFFKNPAVDVAFADSLKEQWADMPLYPIKDDPTKVKLAAGWMIDKAGLKGYQQGRVGVHHRQALVLINLGGATGEELLSLAQLVQQRVRELFGVEIESEVNIIG